MSAQHALKIVFWICPVLLQSLIALVIILRRHVSDFPVFFSYTLFVAGRDCALLVFRGNRQLDSWHIYSWIYFIGEPITILLGLAAIYEVLWRLIRPYSMLRLLGIRLFWISLGVAALIGGLLFKTSPLSRMAASIESARLLQRSAWFVEVGVLIVFILFISNLGLTWRDYTAGIIAGFGVSAGLQLALVELESLQAISGSIFVLLKSAAYNLAVLIWTSYFIPRRVQATTLKELPDTDLARWDELLRRYLSN